MSGHVEFRDGFIFIQGEVTSRTKLETTLRASSGCLRFNLRSLHGFDAAGLQKFVKLMEVADSALLEYHECPRLFAVALTRFRGLLGAGGDPRVVKSLFVSYDCPSCRLELDVVMQTAQISVNGSSISTPPKICPRCRLVMRLGADVKQQFGFLLPVESEISGDVQLRKSAK